MKIKSFFCCLTLAATAFLAGCASTTTESIGLQPQVTIHHQNIGNQTQVGVRVVDDRQSTEVGGRNAWYGKVENIRLTDDFTHSIAEQVNASLAGYQFQTVPYSTDLTRKLTVRILRLNYSQSRGIVTTGTTINCMMQVTAQNGARTYSKTYTGGNNLTNVMFPNARADSKTISAAVADSLNHLLNDHKLLDFLSQ